jgi:hypothetical protein
VNKGNTIENKVKTVKTEIRITPHAPRTGLRAGSAIVLKRTLDCK